MDWTFTLAVMIHLRNSSCLALGWSWQMRLASPRQGRAASHSWAIGWIQSKHWLMTIPQQRQPSHKPCVFFSDSQSHQANVPLEYGELLEVEENQQRGGGEPVCSWSALTFTLCAFLLAEKLLCVSWHNFGTRERSWWGFLCLSPERSTCCCQCGTSRGSKNWTVNWNHPGGILFSQYWHRQYFYRLSGKGSSLNHGLSWPAGDSVISVVMGYVITTFQLHFRFPKKVSL